MIILHGKTALAYYLSHRACGRPAMLDKRQAQKLFLQAKGHVAREQRYRLASMGLYSNEALPAFAKDNAIHILASAYKYRSSSPNASCHVFSGKIEAGCIALIAPDIAIVSPELMMMELSTQMTTAQLVLTGTELCGRYRRSGTGATAQPSNEASGRAFPSAKEERVPALSSTKMLEAFVENRAGEYGVAALRRSVCHIADNSWSPMETITYMMLCLPRTLGGFGMPKATMNPRIDFPSGMKAIDGRDWVNCDLYWPSAHFSLEYDGRLDERQLQGASGHFEYEGKVRDDHKRLILEHLGVRSCSISFQDVRFFSSFQVLATIVAKQLSVTKRKPNARIQEKQWELHKFLLSTLNGR